MTACPNCGFDPNARVIKAWTFVIERDSHSLNARRTNTLTLAGAQYRADRDAWCWWFREARLRERIPKATGPHPRRVRLVRLFGGRQREWDPDNLAGGLKSVVDALVYEGLIAGDAPSQAMISYSQQRGDRRGLEIRLEVLG